ncbi:hypothetical protein THAOC_33263, partial [Thalassiosira oceanica]
VKVAGIERPLSAPGVSKRRPQDSGRRLFGRRTRFGPAGGVEWSRSAERAGSWPVRRRWPASDLRGALREAGPTRRGVDGAPAPRPATAPSTTQRRMTGRRTQDDPGGRDDGARNGGDRGPSASARSEERQALWPQRSWSRRPRQGPPAKPIRKDRPVRRPSERGGEGATATAAQVVAHRDTRPAYGWTGAELQRSRLKRLEGESSR